MLVVTLVSAGVSLIGTPALAAPDPSSVYVESIAYGGTGCPQGTIIPVVSDDGLHFGAVMNGLVAGTGPGFTTGSRKTCTLALRLHRPPALLTSFTVDIVVPGHVNLPAGTTASITSSAWQAAVGTTAKKTMSFTGPVVQDFQLVHTVRRLDLLPLLSTGCSDLLNFKVAANVLGPFSSPAELRVNSMDGTLGATPILGLPC